MHLTRANTSNNHAHLNNRIPLGEEASKASRVLLLNTNSAMNFSKGVVTAGVSAQACDQQTTQHKRFRCACSELLAKQIHGLHWTVCGQPLICANVA
jgi:hypothetical protein